MSLKKQATDQSWLRAAQGRKQRGLRRESDTSLRWMERDCPELAEWRALAIEWLRGETRGVSKRLNALVVFFERYLIQRRLPLEPATFFARSVVLPDFYRVSCPDSKHGIECNNLIHNFLEFVLRLNFSQVVGDRPVISPEFCNPVPRKSMGGLPRLDESVHSPLPYGYVDDLRHILAEGPNFSDWRWAQTALGGEVGRGGVIAPDWFEVNEDQIDRDDPDCTWRVREVSKHYRGGQILEMWSPVRWVALLVKLILPLRTFQVRVLDSGEADTWRYEAGRWTLNTGHRAQGSERHPLQQGVFRRSCPLTDGEAVAAVLYINTNKTADIAKSGPEKGYILPWLSGGPIYLDVFYWLEKLRNWQEKYNPIAGRTSWTELDGRHIKVKSDLQLAGYPDACFLFRVPEAVDGKRHLPLTADTLEKPWYCLLGTLERRLADQGVTLSTGAPVQLLPPPTRKTSVTATLFPLHSLRVSLITALALEGQVPFPILQKLVGHSRLLMTLYYTKPGASYIRKTLLGAAERMEANKASSIEAFLLDTEYDELLKSAICNDVSSVAAAIPQHPGVRNPARWMPMHHGLCLVGGNTSEIEGNHSIGGCYNGGPLITKGSSSASPKHGPVPGGSRIHDAQ